MQKQPINLSLITHLITTTPNQGHGGCWMGLWAIVEKIHLPNGNVFGL